MVKGHLWRHTDFLRIWAGQTVSQFGSQLTLLALPSILILALHGTVFQVGLLSALQSAAFPVFGLLAGVWVDRLHRRPIMIAADLARTIALAAIPIAFILNVLGLGLLYGVAVISGIATVFFEVAYLAYLPALVERQDLVEGNTKLEITRSGAQIVGPLVAGALIQLVGAARVIGIDSLTFLISAGAIASIRHTEPQVPVGHGNRRLIREIGEGLRVVVANPILRRIAACTATWNLGTSIVFAVLLVFAYRQLRLSPATVGFMFAFGSVGWLVGALVAAKLSRRFGLGRTLAISILVGGASYLLMPLAVWILPPVLLSGLLFLQGMQLPIYNINQVSLRQALVPHNLQGRMNATLRTVVWGTIPAGSLIGGLIGSRFGLVPTILIGGTFSVLAGGWLLAQPVLSLQEPPPAVSQ